VLDGFQWLRLAVYAKPGSEVAYRTAILDSIRQPLNEGI